MAETEIVEHVRGLGEIQIVYAPFPEQIRAFNEAGIDLVSVRDASYIRLHGDNRGYTRTCHAPICAKKSPTIIARMSPLVEDLVMAEQAVSAHGYGQYPVFDRSLYDRLEKTAEKDESEIPEERRAIILNERGDFRIRRDSDEARFLWQDTREAYFKEFVSGDSVPCWQIPIDYIDSVSGTIINYVGFNGPVFESGISFRGRLLYDNVRALGLRKSSESTS